MNKLLLLRNMGFKITWKLIGIGLHGDNEIPVSINHDDVLEYLYEILSESGEQTENAIDLICEKDDSVEFDKLLVEFANKDSSDITVQRRKWKAGLLKNLIDNISSDCLQGLLALMEFWLSIGKVEDCPQSFPDRGNKESIQKYFTQSLYTSNLCRNRCWLKKEIKDIIRLES